MRRFVLAFVPALAVLGLSLSAAADGLIVIRDLPPGVRPIPGGPPAFTPLEVRYHHVTAKVSGRVAVTEVDQVFYNPSGSRLEGTYLFPIPKGAQIDEFSMDVNGKMTDAELLGAAKARGIYEEIVRSMRDPALLEYLGQGLFKVRLFPIEPRSEKRVKLKYTSDPDAGGRASALPVPAQHGEVLGPAAGERLGQGRRRAAGGDPDDLLAEPRGRGDAARSEEGDRRLRGEGSPARRRRTPRAGTSCPRRTWSWLSRPSTRRSASRCSRARS